MTRQSDAFNPYLVRPLLDVDSWPTLLIQWPKALDVDEVDDHFDEVTEILATRAGNFVIVVDLTGSAPPNALVRARAGERLRGLAQRFRQRLGGVAYVVPSAFARGAVTAIHWVARVEFPSTAVSTRREATHWAELRLASRPLATGTAR